MGREFTGESAFVDAYSEYFDVVYREALRYSGNHHVAEEIAQDAFFMAYVQNGNESKQQIKAWMLMLAKYRAMNYIRDHKREVSLEEITMSEEKYPDALVDDSSEEYVIAMLKEQGFRKLGIEISCIPRDLIIVIFYYQISLKPLKTLSLAQVSFPLLFPLCYIVPPVFTNSDKGKYKGKKTDNTL